MPTKGYMLRARITDEDHERLKQLVKAYNVDSLSAAIRILIRASEDPETLAFQVTNRAYLREREQGPDKMLQTRLTDEVIAMICDTLKDFYQSRSEDEELSGEEREYAREMVEVAQEVNRKHRIRRKNAIYRLLDAVDLEHHGESNEP